MNFSWIKQVLYQAYPDADWQAGVDLNEDGSIATEERLQDYDGDDEFLDDPQDWARFFGDNQSVLVQQHPYFTWAEPFKLDNPIHDLLSIERELFSEEDIQTAYTFAADVLAEVQDRLSEEMNSEEKVQLVYQVLEEKGASFELLTPSDTILFTTGCLTKTFDCDTSSFMTLMVAHEMGWPLSLVIAPEHVFVRWENEEERFNCDFGEVYSDKVYMELFQLTEEIVASGVYLASLPREGLTALMFSNRGLAKHYLGRFEEAIQDYDQAILINPQDAEAFSNRGLAKYYLGRFEEAIEDYDQAILINPQDAKAFYNRGNAKSYLGRFEEAIEDYNQAILINPQDAKAFYNRGNAKSYLGRFEEAIEDYDQAILINPQYEGTLINRGNAKSALGRFEEAIQDYDQAILINPQLAEALNNRGIAKYDLGRFEEAIEDYDEAILINPQYADAFSNRGNAKYYLGRFEEAIQDYDEAIRINPQHEGALNNRRLAEKKLEKP